MKVPLKKVPKIITRGINGAVFFFHNLSPCPFSLIIHLTKFSLYIFFKIYLLIIYNLRKEKEHIERKINKIHGHENLNKNIIALKKFQSIKFTFQKLLPK